MANNPSKVGRYGTGDAPWGNAVDPPRGEYPAFDVVDPPGTMSPGCDTAYHHPGFQVVRQHPLKKRGKRAR